jgi:hypothetical protein
MSDPLSRNPAQIIDGLEALHDDDSLPLSDATAMLAAAIRLATARSEQEDALIELTDRDVSATQAVSVASALLHAQHLNAFDLELWSAGKYTTH